MAEPTDEGALERYLHLMSECAKDQDWAVHHPEWMTHLHVLWDDLTLSEKRFVNACDASGDPPTSPAPQTRAVARSR
jgi:hypothetical protein